MLGLPLAKAFACIECQFGCQRNLESRAKDKLNIGVFPVLFDFRNNDTYSYSKKIKINPPILDLFASKYVSSLFN